MAEVRRERREPPGAVKKKAPVESVSSILKKDYSHLTLPTAKSIPSNNIFDYSFLFYGEELIGKTTLANEFGSLIFSFEKGTKSVPVYATEILTEWDMALYYLDLCEKPDAVKYPSYCVDTGHAGYDRCLEYICRRDGIKHPGKVKDYGHSWHEVMVEFAAFHTRLARLGGFIVISHDRVREREDRSGNKFDRIEPAFSESAELFYKAIIDLTGYYQKIDGRRYLQIQSTDLIHAGHRIDGHFLTKGGDKIFRVPLGDSPGAAYQNLIRAFNNEQRRTYEEIEMETIAKRKVK